MNNYSYELLLLIMNKCFFVSYQPNKTQNENCSIASDARKEISSK